MKKVEFKELFLNLTQYTIPFGEECRLEDMLPKGYIKDEIGNYYYQVGESETLFTAHLDTYSKKYEKVNHVINDKDEYIISTDGTTILGGDNKLGVTILFSMIKDNVPGTYYFFVGEEPILSGGLYGSSKILDKYPKFFSRFKRVISFDRRGFGSFVQRQMALNLCSDSFKNSLIEAFEKGGIEYDKESDCGYYTDSATFGDIIPECINISAGGFNEHTKEEYVDLNYTYKVYEVAKNIEWEKLPTERKITNRYSHESEIKKLTKPTIKNYEIFTTLNNIFGLTQTVKLVKNSNIKANFSKWLEKKDEEYIFHSDDTIKYNGVIYSYKDLLELLFKKYRLELIKFSIQNLKKPNDNSKEILNFLFSLFGKTKMVTEIQKYLKKKSKI